MDARSPSEAADPSGRLHARFSGSAAYRALTGALAEGRATRSIGGVTPTGAALLFSRLLADTPGRSGLLIASGQEEAEDIHAACRAFSQESISVLFFPSTEKRAREDADPATASARLTVCQTLLHGERAALVVAPVQAVLEEVPSPGELQRSVRRLERGLRLDPEGFVADVASFGFKRLIQVERPGDCARRGGIVDIFPFGRPMPIRLEFDGDTIASLRQFDPVTQRSQGELPGVDCALTAVATGAVLPDPARTIFAFTPPQCLVGFVEEPELREKAIQIGQHAGISWSAAARKVDELFQVCHLKLARFAAPEACSVFPFCQRPPLGDSLETTFTLLRGHVSTGGEYFLYSANEGERAQLRALLQDQGMGWPAGLHTLLGDVREGFTVADRAAVVSTGEVLGRSQVRRTGPVKSFAHPGRGFFTMSPGDLVVHVAHGIGRFLGTEWTTHAGVRREYLVVEYRNGAKLFVPVAKADLLARYVGTSESHPRLDALTGKGWLKRCEAVEQAVHDMASELLEIQARRQETPGFSFPRDDEWQRQLEASFPFEDTPDQTEAIHAVKKDMIADRAMDRLLCGDVGYGKTELAVRAAFKAVVAGRQVAVLVPTTVLAEQHYATFRDRLSAYPVRIEVLSRFRTRGEQKKVLAGLREKSVDIVIGTHRLLSKDVAFADLGLVVIDEEQRFGVMHKEQFKRMRATVDVLTMTATPIPRTLHMALLGLRDISNLTTPPEGRAPVRTEVRRFDPAVIRESVLRELDRDGQVYFVHNRVHSLARVKSRLEHIVPEARIAIAHGQMAERELATTMQRFLRREIDVLATTTIIESGLDIPNVNTIFVSDADMYGLADLHQLRGRVGRYRHQAYAYFLLPEGRPVSRDGEKRLRSIETYSELGAGFQLALKDLELRGAGNILGAQQSGHIAQVGYDMYCRLLTKAVGGIKNDRVREKGDVELGLKIPAYLPEEYVPVGLDRVEIYRRIAATRNEEVLGEEEEALRDRFGSLPRPAALLLDVQRLRIRLSFLGITSVGREDNRPIVHADPATALRLCKLSPYPVRAIGETAYMIDERVPDDREAVRFFLAWAQRLIDKVERSERLVSAS